MINPNRRRKAETTTDAFSTIQTVLDSEADFQQHVLPKLFTKKGTLPLPALTLTVNEYINHLIRHNLAVWRNYLYLRPALKAQPIRLLKAHWQRKYQGGCYIENNAPNLDAASSEELQKVWSCIAAHPIYVAREYFPSRPAGYVAATRDISKYALSKRTAINFRLKDEIARALVYEDSCDRIYNGIPLRFRSW